MMAKRTPNQAEQLTVWDEGSIPSLTSNGAGRLVLLLSGRSSISGTSAAERRHEPTGLLQRRSQG